MNAFVQYAIIVLVTSMLTFFLTITFDFDWVGSAKNASEVPMSFADFAALSMTAASLALGAVALGVGLLAAVGFPTIRRQAVLEAKQSADELIKARLDELLEKQIEAGMRARLQPMFDRLIDNVGNGGPFDEALREAIERVSMSQGQDDIDLANDPLRDLE